MAKPEELLGFTGKDSVTGFTGVITSHVKYLTGCDQFGMTPKIDADGKIRATEYFDVNRIGILPQQDRIVIDTSRDSGGPNRDAPSR